MLDTDDGSRSLGEVALISYDSPISNSNILFYNTLFDENASCHLALGKCYPTNVKGGSDMTSEELHKLGGNDSMIHVDFMFGSRDMSVTGTTYDDKEVDAYISFDAVNKIEEIRNIRKRGIRQCYLYVIQNVQPVRKQRNG